MRQVAKVAIAGILLVVGLVLLQGRGDRKVDAYYAALRSDMRRAIEAESAYFAANRRYTTNLDSLMDPFVGQPPFNPSTGVQLTIRVDSGGWELVGRHQFLPTACTWRDGTPPRPAPDFSGIRRLCTDPP